MSHFLLDFPLELQIKVVSYLELMDVCLLMQVPALEPCILARLPRDKIDIINFGIRDINVYKTVFSLSNDIYYPDYNKINYNSRQLQMLLKFLSKVKLSKPINLLSLRGLSSLQVQSLFVDYLDGWGNSIFKRVQISDYPQGYEEDNGRFLNVPWRILPIMVEAYCISESKKTNLYSLLTKLMTAENSSNLENQKAFLAYCFLINLRINDSTLDFSVVGLSDDSADQSVPIYAFEGQIILSLVIKFRNCILESESLIQKTTKTLVSGSHVHNNLTYFTSFQNLEKLFIDSDLLLRLADDIQKFSKLKDLKIVSYKQRSYELKLKFPNLLKLVLLNYKGKLNLFNTPRLEELSVEYSDIEGPIDFPVVVQNTPQSMRFLALGCGRYIMTQNSLFTPNHCYRSLQALTLLRIGSLDDLSKLKDACPGLRNLEIGLDYLQCDSLDFASYLPQTIINLTLIHPDFEVTKVDFSGLANLRGLVIVTMTFSVSNVVWGKTITTLGITFTGKFVKGDFIIGNGTLNQLQHLSLMLLKFEDHKLDFGPDSMLQTLLMLDVKTPRDGLCKNLKYLEVLQDQKIRKFNPFYSPEFSALNDLNVYMDFRYTDPNNYGYHKVILGTGNQSISDEKAMNDYTKLKNAYGLQPDPLVFHVYKNTLLSNIKPQ